jgi:hypothetical protein
MIISTVPFGGALKGAAKIAARVVVAVTALLPVGGCDKDPTITVRDEVKSPDGKWTVQTQYENWDGPGNNYEATRVVISLTGKHDAPQEILSLEANVSDIVITWRDNHHLELVYRKGPKVTFQVVRLGDVDISAVGESV